MPGCAWYSSEYEAACTLACLAACVQSRSGLLHHSETTCAIVPARLKSAFNPYPDDTYPRSVTMSLAAMANVSLVVMLFFLIFAILGVQVGM